MRQPGHVEGKNLSEWFHGQAGDAKVRETAREKLPQDFHVSYGQEALMQSRVALYIIPCKEF